MEDDGSGRGLVTRDSAGRGGRTSSPAWVSVARLEQSWARFVDFFGEKASVVDITPPKLHDDVARRTEDDGVEPPTVKTEPAALRRAIIMQLCGRKTRSVFDRYRIVRESDLAEGLAKLGAATTPPKPRKVTPMKTRRAG